MPQSQHATLAECIVNIRLRMSDPHRGTLGLVRYDRLTENVDEMKLIANEAAREVVVACCSPTTALLRSVNLRMQVVSGKVEYGINDDYLSVDYVEYIKDGQEYDMFERAVGDFPKNRDNTYVRNTNEQRYKYYDIYGVGAIEKAIGVIRQSSLKEVHDPFNTFNNIRTGDTVFNMSDGSQGVVVDVVPGESVLNARNETEIRGGYVIVDQLEGGRANRFVQGDNYLISSEEEINETMHVHPKIEFDETNIKVYSGRAIDWSVQDPFTLHALDITINNVPDNIEDDDRLIVEVLRGGELVTKDPPSIISKVGVTKGVNRFVFDARVFTTGILIEEDTNYSLRATIGARELTIDSVDIFAYGTNDFVNMSYSRLAKKMTHDRDICEIPPYALSMYYTQAQIIATKKVTGSKDADPGLLAERNIHKMEIEDLLWNRTPRGTSNMSDGAPRQRRAQQINGVDAVFVDYYVE